MAGGQGVTGVLTSLIETGRVIWTVSISDTLRLWVWDNWLLLGSAGDQGVAHPAWRTGALGVVVLYTAGGGGGTWVLVQARVGTFVVDTGRGLGTVLVDPTLHSDTVDVGITLQSWRTSAGRLVVGGVALGVGSTGVVSDAGVKTISVSTNLGDGALGVGGAAN